VSASTRWSWIAAVSVASCSLAPAGATVRGRAEAFWQSRSHQQNEDAYRGDFAQAWAGKRRAATSFVPTATTPFASKIIAP